MDKNRIVEFDFKDGSTLELVDIGVSIIQFNSFEYECQVGSIRSKRQADSSDVADDVEDKKRTRGKIIKLKNLNLVWTKCLYPQKKLSMKQGSKC